MYFVVCLVEPMICGFGDRYAILPDPYQSYLPLILLFYKSQSVTAADMPPVCDVSVI